MFSDFLRNTPVYQEAVEEGREEGLRALSNTFVRLVELRFPTLAAFARQQVEGVKIPGALEDATVCIATAQNVQEAALCLVTLGAGDKKN